MMEELVVLVDDHNNPIGTAAKDTVHTKDTPLHRAFSLFLFNSKNELLVTQRASTKKTFAGVWTNTLCGHPAPQENTADAAVRRLNEELGITGVQVKEVSPYRYTFADKNGIVENEICPILVGYFDGNPTPKFGEVDAWKWMDWKQFLEEIKINPEPYSPWCVEEARLIHALKLPQTDSERR